MTRMAGSTRTTGDYRWGLLATLFLCVALPACGDFTLFGEENLPTAVAAADPTSTTACETGTVTLDGTLSTTQGSTGVLLYHWEFLARPAGSAATISSPSSSSASFSPDLPGAYRIELTVADELGIAASEVVVTASSQPLADAGANQTGSVGVEVELDGSESMNPAEGCTNDGLTFAWVLTDPGGEQTDLDAVPAPTFTPTVAGTHTAELTVSAEGVAAVGTDSVLITVSDGDNTPPQASASASPETLPACGSVTLDGSGSTDADEDPLTYAWAFTTRPEGSAASILDPAGETTSFATDLPGAYAVELTVDDGAATDTVSVSVTAGDGPIADPGTYEGATVGTEMTLDGSGSKNHNASCTSQGLTFSWTVTDPDSLEVTLTDPDTVSPRFTPTKTGDYEISLTVTIEGTTSEDTDAVTVNVTGAENQAPDAVASVSPTETGACGTATVMLDGLGSSDPDSDPLDYLWELTSLPAGSGATVDQPDAATTSFSPDVPGTYAVKLTVDDGETTDTDSRNVTAGADPIADAGSYDGAVVGETVDLDGTGSVNPGRDCGSDGLSYAWTVTGPGGAGVTLTDAETASPSFTPAEAGQYDVSLTVTETDGDLTGTDTASVAVVEPGLDTLQAGPYAFTVSAVDDNVFLLGLFEILLTPGTALPGTLDIPATSDSLPVSRTLDISIPTVASGSLVMDIDRASPEDDFYTLTGSADVDASPIDCQVSADLTGFITPVTSSEVETSVTLSDVQLSGAECATRGLIVVNAGGQILMTLDGGLQE